MYLAQSALLSASARVANVQRSAPLAGQRVGFLCHSHKDRLLALGLQQHLKDDGLDLYIDWQDSTMPAEPNRETADRIKAVIRGAHLFLFLATENSMASRWCPWEIGYADGTKNNAQIVMVPTRDSGGRYHGNEYLQLYRRLETPASTGPIYWYPVGAGSAGGPVRTL